MAGSDSDITKIWLEAAKRQQERIEAEAVDFAFPDWTQVSAETYATAVTPKEALDRLPPLASAEAERVAKALLDHWGKTLTEKRAVELAKGMCPENRVSRDGFLETFRAIRGPKMPGKQPSTGK